MMTAHPFEIVYLGQKHVYEPSVSYWAGFLSLVLQTYTLLHSLLEYISEQKKQEYCSFIHWICNALAYTGCFFSLGLSLFSNQKTSQQSYQRFSKIENFTKHKGWLPKSYIIFDTENKNTLFFWGTLDNNLTVTRKMSLICFVLVVLLFMMMIVMGMTLTVWLHEG